MPDGQQPWPNLTSEEHASLIQQFQDACPGGVDEEQHELSKTNVRPPPPTLPCPPPPPAAPNAGAAAPVAGVQAAVEAEALQQRDRYGHTLQYDGPGRQRWVLRRRRSLSC